jgi:hypothetical protein
MVEARRSILVFVTVLLIFHTSTKVGLILIIRFPWISAILVMGASVLSGTLKSGAKVELPGKLETCLRQARNGDAMQVVFKPWLDGKRLPKRFGNDWVPPFGDPGERFQIRFAQLQNLRV